MRDILFYANFSTLVFLQLLVWQSNRAPKIDPTEAQKFDSLNNFSFLVLMLHFLKNSDLHEVDGEVGRLGLGGDQGRGEQARVGKSFRSV